MGRATQRGLPPRRASRAGQPQERAPQGGPTSGAPISKDPGWGATRGAYLIGARVSRGPTWGARSWGELTSAAQRAGPRNSSATPTAPSRRSFPRGNPAGALAERCPSRASMSADFSRSARNWRGRFVPWRSAQIRTGSFPAYGSYLGWLTAKRSRASILGLLGPDCLGLEVEQDQTCHGAVGHAYPAAICCSARGDAADHLPSAG